MTKRPAPSDRPLQFIRITGARQNNLQNVDVQIPKGRLTVVTGVSGSGKSSLAMETLYAEGQRRYLEGVSAYARRFLERLPRPLVDHVEGISPAVALDQRTGARSARSTVGTSTEIYDYLRLLFARAGTVHCDRCGGEVRRWTVQTVASTVAAGKERRLLIAFPFSRARRSRATAIQFLRRRGYLRLVIGGDVADVEHAPRSGGEWYVLQDRVGSRNRARVVEALEAAFREGEGKVLVQAVGERGVVYRAGRVCVDCDITYPEPVPQHFSFNNPMGACPECNGFGHILDLDPAKIVPDPHKTLQDGAVKPWARRWRGYFMKKLEASPSARRIPRRTPWKDLKPEHRELLLCGDRTFPGVIPFLTRLGSKSYKAGARFLVKRYQTPRPCTVCGGTRLRPDGLRIRIDDATLPEWCALPVTALHERMTRLSLTGTRRETVASVLADLDHRLQVLERVGLGYLSLDRLTRTLSGGESQRIELAQALGAGLVGALYVLDEPTVGLHPRDTGRLLEVLKDLTDQGNTVVVVEHDRDVIQSSDWMVDLGPGAGRDGGQVVYCGASDRRREGPASATVDLLRDAKPRTRPPVRRPEGWLRVRDAGLHNLRGIDVDIPWGVMAGVCGVSGSGKSTLVVDTLMPLLEALGRKEDAGGTGPSGTPRTESVPELGTLLVEAPLASFQVVDQTPLAQSARSVPASYVGAWSAIRALFASTPDARRRGLRPGDFSFNVAGGRCEACRGEGETMVDMDFMADVRLPCESCSGTRFSPKIRDIRYRGRSIVDILALTVAEALSVFRGSVQILRPLWWMDRVGLGYLTLGQPASALSGGEAQRLKLVRELAVKRDSRLVILDEPTVGLHGAEVARLIQLLKQLVSAGNSVLVIEHHVEVLAGCDWLIELGPDGGDAGGDLVAAGPPDTIIGSRDSRIAPYLRPLLTSGPTPSEDGKRKARSRSGPMRSRAMDSG